MSNNVQLDVEEIAARFYLTNVAISDVKSGDETLNTLSTEQFSPSIQDVADAKTAIVDNATIIGGVPTCAPCTINNVNYYGLTASQCSAMGGTCNIIAQPKKR